MNGSFKEKYVLDIPSPCGFFKKVFESKEKNHEERLFADGILFALEPGKVSPWHKVDCEEVFLHKEGSPLRFHLINSEGVYSTDVSSSSFSITANTWFAFEVENSTDVVSESLFYCICIPGFSAEKYEQANGDQIIELFSSFSTNSSMTELIQRLGTSVV